MVSRILLFCGIVASLLFVTVDATSILMWQAYDPYTQTVSELSAIGAPTRTVWVKAGVFYGILMAAFGSGVIRIAQGRRLLGVAGILLMLYGLLGLFCPPMHQRAALAAGEKSITDTLHLIFTGVSVCLMLASMILGMLTLHKWFRAYTILSIVTLLIFGLLTAAHAPLVEANLPTPWLGIWERINIATFLLWVIIFALQLIRKTHQATLPVMT